MKQIIIVAASLAMSGCAGQSVPGITVMGDSYCSVAKKQTWSTSDTPETIDQVRRHNARVDRLCGKPQ